MTSVVECGADFDTCWMSEEQTRVCCVTSDLTSVFGDSDARPQIWNHLDNANSKCLQLLIQALQKSMRVA